jgi:alkylated DNA repair dioxygenase AlkB
MTLFNDTELFSSGTGGKKQFEVPDAELVLIDNFFSKEESDYYYTTSLYQTQWLEYDMPMYDKVVTAPRMISWYSDANLDAPESSQSWPTELQTIRERVEKETHIQFNAVLLNLYRNGKDGVGWHSDKTKSSNTNMDIVFYHKMHSNGKEHFVIWIT